MRVSQTFLIFDAFDSFGECWSLNFKNITELVVFLVDKHLIVLTAHPLPHAWPWDPVQRSRFLSLKLVCSEEIPLCGRVGQNPFPLGDLMQNSTSRDRIGVVVISVPACIQIRWIYSRWERKKKEQKHCEMCFRVAPQRNKWFSTVTVLLLCPDSLGGDQRLSARGSWT